MPGVSRTQRVEAKYNVVTEFPHLGLHSAAATGNVGLVKYALDHGQPINSVLDGVLPLHVACSGGNDFVVRLLIDKGADVNAPRLPRRYSSDKHRDASAPIIGTSGSTPLHFACANGHCDVVLTLLLHGARPDHPDKHGVTPEMVARQNGWLDCADLLKEWTHNKDKDLRERDANIAAPADVEPVHRHADGSTCPLCGTGSARLRVKRSIDNAFNILRPSLSQVSSASPTERNDASLARFDTRSSAPAENMQELPPRRPSLPHVFESPESSPSLPGTSTPSVSMRSHASRQSSGTSARRPSSAGTGAETPSGSHKLKGKISLLSIFKKSISDTPGTPDSFSTYDSSSSALTSAASSPPPDARPSLSTRSSSQSKLTHLPNDSFSSPGPATRYRSRLQSESQPRTGILRPHYRTMSSGESQSDFQPPSKQPSIRALRFDSSASMSDAPRISMEKRRASRSPVRQLASASASRDSLRHRDHSVGPVPTARTDGRRAGDVEDDEEQYGEIIAGGEGIVAHMETHSCGPTGVCAPHCFDCPFSINRTPPDEAESSEKVPGLVPQAEGRGRGDSVSSAGTDASGNPTSSSGASVQVMTPSATTIALPHPHVTSPTRMLTEGILGHTHSPDAEEPAEFISAGALEKTHALHRPRAPLDIDIHLISSHAQAEALVARTQKSILEMQDLPGDAAGHSPLSAKLAAYGESLALQRRLKLEEEQRSGSAPSTANSVTMGAGPGFAGIQAARLAEIGEASGGKGLDRKFSLEERRPSGGHPGRPRKVKRPHTAGSTTTASTEVLHTSPSNHQHSPSLQITLTTPPSDSTSEPRNSTSSITPPRRSHLRAQTDVRSTSRSRMSRSRTPDPGRHDIDLSTSYPLEPIPLSRCSTAPERDIVSAKREREAARTAKLAKMGFSPADYQNAVLGHARGSSSNKPRFGGIKTFVQSFKTKP